MEKIENNLLLAKFMGAKIIEPNNFIYIDHVKKWGHKQDELKYNDNWNWIMQVVEKIENLEGEYHDFTVYINNNVCKIGSYENYPHLHIFEQAKTKIEAVYNACVEFVKWYNDLKY